MYWPDLCVLAEDCLFISMLSLLLHISYVAERSTPQALVDRVDRIVPNRLSTEVQPYLGSGSQV